MVDTVLGHYRIVQKLGRGGMGEVYKARDLHLDRFVAIKVLPPDKVADPERKTRFVQEARAASALHHPNIIVVYDIDADHGVDYIAMEYVPGQTLSQLLDEKRLSLQEVLTIGIQIADALAKAHQAGIIHRDLKPANIMVAEDGTVKLLDFGLAKLGDGTAGQTDTKTIADSLTNEGAVMGTATYMSPEQAEGKRLDRRSDIFSFGLVLYEMITGQPAFQRGNTVSTLAAILRDEPRSIRDTVENVPPDLERVVNRCLRKDPARRFQHMDDVHVELQEIKDTADSGRFAAAPAVAVARSGPPRWYGAAAAVVCLGVAGALWVWYSGDSRRNFTSGPLLKRLTSDSGLSFQPSLSPDGKWMAYSSDRSGDGSLDIWVQQLAGGEPVRLTRDPADDQDPTFSPDGSRIAFSSGRGGGGIYVMSALGGAEEKLADAGFSPRFSPDGKSIAYRTGDRVAGTGGTGAVYVISAQGGTPRRVAESFTAAVAPVWSPDGKSILIFGANRVEQREDLRHAGWVVVRLDSGGIATNKILDQLQDQHLAPPEYTTATQHLMPIASSWTDGYIYFSAFRGQTSNIWRLPVSREGVRSTGPAERLTTGTALESDPSVTAKGDTLIAFTSLSENADLWSVPILPDAAKTTGELQRITRGLGADVRPSISLDGNILVYNSNPAGNWDVLLKDLRTGAERILASSEQHEENPRITSDGSEVLYRVARDVFSIPAGGGVKRKIADDCGGLFPWSTHSRTFLCVDGSGVTLADADSARKNLIVRTSGYALRLSWDDRWVTFYKNVSGGYTRIYVAPVNAASPANEGDLIPITSGKSWDALPEFSPDGAVLYFQSERWQALFVGATARQEHEKAYWRAVSGAAFSQGRAVATACNARTAIDYRGSGEDHHHSRRAHRERMACTIWNVGALRTAKSVAAAGIRNAGFYARLPFGIVQS